MKTILLLRHGKSKRGFEYATDFERPLAKRGKRDAARMGAFLVEQDLVPDLILASPAERARDTAVRCAKAAGCPDALRFERSLYGGGDEVYLSLLWALEETVNRVLFVAHNPDIEIVVESLGHRYARMPTAALARIDADVERWVDLFKAPRRLVWVQYPRELEAVSSRPSERAR
jgi:phosphohistidine phosphatase